MGLAEKEDGRKGGERKKEKKNEIKDVFSLKNHIS